MYEPGDEFRNRRGPKVTWMDRVGGWVVLAILVLLAFVSWYA